MTFDKDYWEDHWQHGSNAPANPYLAEEIGDQEPATALDAGCGAGAEAIWLADRGWHVTAVDISARALEQAAARSDDVRWIEADLSTWRPDMTFDLVMTHYAHPAMPQLDFYDRIADWVAPGGTLLIVGHRHTVIAEAEVTAEAVIKRLDTKVWTVVTAQERERALTGHGKGPLHDVIVRARRRATA